MYVLRSLNVFKTPPAADCRVGRKNAVLDEWKLLVTNTSYSYGFDVNTTTNHDNHLSHAFEVSVVDLFDRAYNSLL